MFYLKEFFKSLGESIFRGFSFFLFSCLLAFALTHRPWIAQTLEKISPEKMVNPYFVAVMDGKISPDKIRKIAAGLPGVMGITSADTQGQNKLRTLVQGLGADYTVSQDMLDFKSLRIVLSPTLSSESLEFIRSEILKAAKSENLSATPIRYPEVANVMNTHPFYQFLAKAGDWGVVGIIALFWIISYWLSYNVFRSRSYIIEKFQRRKLVAAKSYASGLAVVVIGFSALGIWNGTLKFFDLVILLMVFSVFWSFSMQEWRWKPTL